MCTPSQGKIFAEPCGFVDIPKRIIQPEEIPNLNLSEKPFTEINFNQMDEFLDYLKFPTITLAKGTVLCHSGRVRNFYSEDKGVNLNTIYWWNKYFPGQASFKGGWFTYETSYGGPDFGLNLYYMLEEDLTLPFISNDFNEKYIRSDPRYFSEYYQLKNKLDILSNIIRYLRSGNSKWVDEMNNYINTVSDTENDLKVKELIREVLAQPPKSKAKFSLIPPLTELKKYYSDIISKFTNKRSDTLAEYSTIFRGSHIIEGVEDWEKKGYKPIEHPLGSYADNLAIKLAELGFNGYISCDECEVYITHTAMQRVLTKPFSYELHKKALKNKEFLTAKSLMEKSFEIPVKPLTVTNVIDRQISGEFFMTADEFLEQYHD